MDDTTLLGYWSDNKRVYVKFFKGDSVHLIEDTVRPFLFLPSGNVSDFKSIYGYPLYKKEFDSVSDMRRSFEDGHMEKFHGTLDSGLQYVSELFRLGVGDTRHFTVMYFDIEVECEEGFPDVEDAKWPVNAISAIVEGRKFLFRYYEREPDVGDDVVHVLCKNELDMLEKFSSLIRKKNVDVLTGWYINGFDIPYLVKRMKRHFGEDAMDKWSVFNRHYITKKGKLCVYGLNIIDMMEAYKKFEKKPRPSYRLDVIADIEIGEKKHKISDDVSGFDLWKHEKYYDDFFRYSMQDTVLLEKIDKKKGIIDLMIAIGIKTHSNIEDVIGTVKVWENYFYAGLYQSGRVPFLSRKDKRDSKSLIGAFVLDPIVGKHEWVVSFDLTSLYPSLMIGLNMSPETIVDGDYDGDVCVASNGVRFSKEKVGVVPEFLKKLFSDRQEYKKKMFEYAKRKDEEKKDFYDLRQKAVKVLMNGLYGAMSNEWFNFYDFRIAEAITTSGRRVNEVMRKGLQLFLEKNTGLKKEFVVAGDTDSAYVTMADLLSDVPEDNKFEVLKEIVDVKMPSFIKKLFEKMAKNDFNAIEQRFHADREAIARAAIFTAKKKYCMLVLDSEGVPAKRPDGDLKVTGLESVKGTHYGKKAEILNEAYRICLSGTRSDLIFFMKEKKKEFFEWDVDEVSVSVGVNSLERKEVGTPFNVLAALTYNDALERGMFNGEYEPIKEGEKVRLAYLLSGNPYGSHVIAWLPLLCPPEIEEWVDKAKQFEKLIAQPVNIVASAIGWQLDFSFTESIMDI